MRAHSLIRPQPWYRAEAFAQGLRAAGHEVSLEPPGRCDRDTLLVIWNRYGGMHETARKVEAGGGTVIVAENGYLGRGGTQPKFDVHPGGPQPHHYYSVALGWHNGRGRWVYGGPERFAALGVKLKDWRTAGEHVLVCPNRSFGVGEQVMPTDWADRTAARLGKSTMRRIVIRRHPGNDSPKRPLAADLANAWAVVIWSSGAGVHALIDGIPVFCEAPYWILKGAAAHGPIDAPVLPDAMTRQAHFEYMAWAQWTLKEIESGEPFRYLLRAPLQEKIA